MHSLDASKTGEKKWEGSSVLVKKIKFFKLINSCKIFIGEKSWLPFLNQENLPLFLLVETGLSKLCDCRPNLSLHERRRVSENLLHPCLVLGKKKSNRHHNRWTGNPKKKLQRVLFNKNIYQLSNNQCMTWPLLSFSKDLGAELESRRIGVTLLDWV